MVIVIITPSLARAWPRPTGGEGRSWYRSSTCRGYGDVRHRRCASWACRRRAGGSRCCDEGRGDQFDPIRSEEHTSELQSLMRISYAVFCLKKKTNLITKTDKNTTRIRRIYTTSS